MCSILGYQGSRLSLPALREGFDKTGIAART